MDPERVPTSQDGTQPVEGGGSPADDGRSPADDGTPPVEDGTPPPEDDDPAGELADVLSDRYCREAIVYLGEASGTVEVSDLARAVAARVRGESSEQVPDGVTRRIQTLLHLGHLPTLAEYGVVAFDADSGRVRLLRTPQW